MDSARPGEVFALKFENCENDMRVRLPSLHMHAGVVQFEQWQPVSKKTEHGNDREGSLAQRDIVSPTASRRHAARTLSSPYCSAARNRTLFSGFLCRFVTVP